MKMQNTFKNQQGREFLFQNLAEGATDIKLDHGGIYYTYDKDLITETNCYKRIRDKGTYQIICLSKNATEEQAAMMVDKSGGNLFDHDLAVYYQYEDYTSLTHRFQSNWFKTAKESLTSLLTSLGFKQDDNVLILEKI